MSHILPPIQMTSLLDGNINLLILPKDFPTNSPCLFPLSAWRDPFKLSAWRRISYKIGSALIALATDWATNPND